MADAKDKKQEAAAEAPKSNKKLIIIIAIAVIIAIAASVGATLFFLGSDSNAENASTEPAAPAEPVKKPALYADLKPQFVVTFDVGGKQRYMQVYVTAMGRDKAALDGLELHMPVIRNQLIRLFSSQDFVQLQSNEGKENLRAECLKAVNSVVHKETGSEIEEILFTNFVMQ